MPEKMFSVLEIAAITICLLVFGNFLIWTMLGFINMLTTKPNGTQSNEGATLLIDDADLRKTAAIAAVSAAIALEQDSAPHEFPLPPTALVSAWQAVMRSNILNRNGRPR